MDSMRPREWKVGVIKDNMDSCSVCKKATFCALVKIKTDPPKHLCELCLKNINLVADKKDYEDCENCGYYHHIEDRCPTGAATQYYRKCR